MTVSGNRLTAVNYQAGDVRFLVVFDPQTGLPARVRTLDADPGELNVMGRAPPAPA